ncbi:MAG: hydrolase [Candidatus Hinthialibacter antarcticus]|nr:hydrolase [Candidatus Hinthialibacter antarcticus]
MGRKRHETILRRDDAVLLVVDYQQRIVDVMKNGPQVTSEIERLVQAMQILSVPVLVTEQYPKGLGPTLDSIAQQVDASQISQKMTFSCCGEEAFWKQLEETKRKQIVVTGIETHVCVMQTVLDLLANGYQVHLPIGATCSRDDANRDNAIARMRDAGAIITNIESVIFELLVEAGTDDFKAARKLIV